MQRVSFPPPVSAQGASQKSKRLVRMRQSSPGRATVISQGREPLAAVALSASGNPGYAARGRAAAARRKPSLNTRLRARLQGVFHKMRVVKTQLHETKQHEARVSDLLQESQQRLELAKHQLGLAK